jgi:hypothetical protein
LLLCSEVALIANLAQKGARFASSVYLDYLPPVLLGFLATHCPMEIVWEEAVCLLVPERYQAPCPKQEHVLLVVRDYAPALAVEALAPAYHPENAVG